jgi:AcrR family transcriptional regulator
LIDSQARAAGETRTERRRARTRRQLVEAAQRLLREQGVEATSVQQITEAADVGLGTFYLHFASKVEVIAAVIESLMQAQRAAVERRTSSLEDPAEIAAAALRITLREVVRDPLWSWFLLRSGLPAQRLREAFGEHAASHVVAGIASGRFVVADLDVAAAFLTGAIAGIVSERVAGALGEDAESDATELFLVTLGVPREEAAAIAHAPLPRNEP